MIEWRRGRARADLNGKTRKPADGILGSPTSSKCTTTTTGTGTVTLGSVVTGYLTFALGGILMAMLYVMSSKVRMPAKSVAELTRHPGQRFRAIPFCRPRMAVARFHELARQMFGSQRPAKIFGALNTVLYHGAQRHHQRAV